MTKLLTKLLRESPIPLYQQLLNEIRARIASGEWVTGTRLPTETELAAELGVSRVTIRQALGAAVDAGLVVRIAGKGTYVAKPTNAVPHQSFVGYVVPHLSSNFNVQILLGVESILKAEGFQLIFCNSESRLDEENRLLGRLEAEGMAGYIIQPVYAERDERILGDFVQKGYPVVLIDRDVPNIQADVVMSDHFAGGYAIVQHLIEQGFQEIVYLARRPLDLLSIAERHRGYQAAMLNAGLRPRPPFLVGGPLELGYNQGQNAVSRSDDSDLEAIVEFLRRSDRPEAIVAMNDLHALLVYMAAERAGLSIANELAVVGFDDLDFAANLNPPLTTVAQQSYQLGVWAAQRLLARIRGDGGAVQRIQLSTELMLRGSSVNLSNTTKTRDKVPPPAHRA